MRAAIDMPPGSYSREKNMRDTMEEDLLPGQQKREITPGDHICVLLRDAEARTALLTGLFADTSKKGWKVLYIARSSTPEYIAGIFPAGEGKGKGQSSNDLEILSSDDPAFYLAFIDHEHARNFMRTAVSKAAQEKFSSLCIIREVPPIPYRPRSSQRVTGDMAGIEKLLEDRAITLICLYEMDLFPSEVLQDVLRTHPKAIIEGELTENIFYIPSSDARKYSLSSLELGHWIRTLLNLTHIRSELEESEARFHDLLENANDLIQSVDPDGKFLYTNRAWRDRLGYDESEVADLTLFDVIDPSCVDECRLFFTRVMEGCALEHIDTIFRTRTGEKVHVEGNVNCKIHQGKPVYTRGIFREMGQSPGGLESGAARVPDQILESMREGVIAVDGKGGILYANRAARMPGAGSARGVTGRIASLSDIIAPGETGAVVARLSQPVPAGGGTAVEFPVTLRDGSTWILEIRELNPDQPPGSRLILLKPLKFPREEEGINNKTIY
jgi:PAS domain S-box-containing protein